MDIMCDGNGCPVKETCRMFTTEPIERQHYFDGIPGKWEEVGGVYGRKLLWKCDIRYMQFNHGYATLKTNYHHIEAGDRGIITAYLPEDGIFSVHFGKSGWCTFEMDLKQFSELFDVELT